MGHITSSGFRCRNLKDGADFLLSNETKAAEYLEMNFTQIFDLKKRNGEGFIWSQDQVNGLLSDYEDNRMCTYDLMTDEALWNGEKLKIHQKFSQISDLIDEFNLHGFHDLCNVVYFQEVTCLHYLPPWFGRKNASGTCFT